MNGGKMDIPTSKIKELRELASAGIMDCRNALVETEGDLEKAHELLKEKGYAKAQKKAERVASQGLVECYIHTGGRVGSMIELNCETDFVARTDDFKQLAHEVAMQIAAMNPICISTEEMPEDTETEPEVACLLLQPYIKSPDQTIQDIITAVIAKTGENIKVGRFARFELGVE